MYFLSVYDADRGDLRQRDEGVEAGELHEIQPRAEPVLHLLLVRRVQPAPPNLGTETGVHPHQRGEGYS